MSQKAATKELTFKPCQGCNCYCKDHKDNKSWDNSSTKGPQTRIHITTTECPSSDTQTSVLLDDPSSEVFPKRSSLYRNNEESKVATPSSIQQRDSDLKPKEKRRCFGCKKKKENKTNERNSAAQTSQTDIKNSRTQSSERSVGKSRKNDDGDVEIVETAIGDVGGCPHCKKSNGLCNNNTIVFPRDQLLRSNRFYDDGLENLRHLIKTEARWNSRTMEDILRQLDKQRRDVKELKEMFELFIRLSKENLIHQAFTSNNGNDNMKRMSCVKNDGDRDGIERDLERKSNSTSINSLKNPADDDGENESIEIIKKQIHEELERDVDESKKKKSLFSCFG